MKIKKIIQLIAAEVIVAAVIVIALVLAYAWITPRYYHGVRMPSIMILGVAIGAVLSGTIATRMLDTSGFATWIAAATGALLMATVIVLGVLGALTRVVGS